MRFHSVMLTILIFLLSGCANLEVREVEGEFEGIKSSFEQNRYLKVLVIHGMGQHKPGYAKGLVDAIAKKMNLMPEFRYWIEEIRRENNQRTYGYLRVQDYKNNLDDLHLRVYELTWSPITQPIKDIFLGYDNSGKAQSQRKFLNHLLKEQMMNQRMSEPVLYIGKYKKEMQFPLKWAFQRMIDDDFGDGRDEIVVITASLGSYMMYDTLTMLGSEPEDHLINTDEFFVKLKAIVMLANQLPLLLMSEVTSIGGQLGEIPDEGWNESSQSEEDWFEYPIMKNFVQMRTSAYKQRNPGKEIPPLSMVAISDPNDILSYALPGYLAEENDYVNYVNVTVNLTPTDSFPFFANPVEAHINHENSDEVIHFIVHGSLLSDSESSESIKLKKRHDPYRKYPSKR